MRGLVTVIFMVVVAVFAVSFSFVSASKNEDKIRHKGSNSFEFSTFTSAVCEENDSLVYCKDEVFVNCNGTISKADKIAECNGMSFDVNGATGFAVFEKGWDDPRN